MRTLNPAHLEAITRRIIDGAPFMTMLNMKVTRLDFGVCDLEVPLIPGHLHAYGAVHGGVYAGIIDTAAYWACYCDMGEDEGFVSLDLNVHNLASAKEGSLFVEGRALELGKTMLMAEARVKDQKGRVIAYGTSKLLRRESFKNATQILEQSDEGALPPKFL